MYQMGSITIVCALNNPRRRRCRMFPSLVNCCTIDWFTKWPNDALLSVAQTFIVPSITDDINKATPLVSVCVLMHEVCKLRRSIATLSSK